MAKPQTTKTGQIVTRENRPKDRATNMRELVKRMGPQIAQALPKHISSERLIRVAMTAITRDPKLAECTPASFMACLLTAAQLGLEPNTPLGQGYLIPRNKKVGNEWIKECTWQTGYQGLIDLAYRSGMVTGISANVVRESDFFQWEEGLAPMLVHRPSTDDDRATQRIKCVYGICRIRNADPHFVVLPFSEIERRRMMNEAEKKGYFSPWKDHYEAMACKTAVRAALKYCPKSAEMQRAESLESAGEGTTTMSAVIDYRVADVLQGEGLQLDQAPEDGEPKQPPETKSSRRKTKTAADETPETPQPPSEPAPEPSSDMPDEEQLDADGNPPPN